MPTSVSITTTYAGEFAGKYIAATLGIPVSAAITCVKPSGTVSQHVNSGGGPDIANYDGTPYGADILPEVGDIVMWNESYWEIDNVNDNQLFTGKDPAYPYNENPLNPGLENYGSNYSIICTAHYTPSDKVQITRERL